MISEDEDDNDQLKITRIVAKSQEKSHNNVILKSALKKSSMNKTHNFKR